MKELNMLIEMYLTRVRTISLDYGGVIFHNQRADLMDLVERIQYKALIVSGCWQGTSREKLYDELGWESLSDRRGSSLNNFLQNKKWTCSTLLIRSYS